MADLEKLNLSLGTLNSTVRDLVKQGYLLRQIKEVIQSREIPNRLSFNERDIEITLKRAKLEREYHSEENSPKSARKRVEE